MYCYGLGIVVICWLLSTAVTKYEDGKFFNAAIRVILSICIGLGIAYYFLTPPRF